MVINFVGANAKSLQFEREHPKEVGRKVVYRTIILAVLMVLRKTTKIKMMMMMRMILQVQFLQTALNSTKKTTDTSPKASLFSFLLSASQDRYQDSSN